MHARRTGALATAIALLLGAATAAAQAPTRHLSGTVTDSATGSPVAFAIVEAPAVARRTMTGPDGHFDLAGLPPDRLRVVVRLVGYAPAEHLVDLRTADQDIRVTLASRTIELQAIAVEADTAAARLRAPEAAVTLDAPRLAATRGQTLGETIRQLPGVTTIQFGPGVAKPVIRGLHSQRVLVLNGGVRQEGQQWGTEHAPEIDSFDADRITVTRGVGSVLHASDALGGVVQVERPPLPNGAPLRGDASVNVFANNGQGAVSARLESGRLTAPVIGPFALRGRVTGRIAGDARAPDYAVTNTGFRELDVSVAAGVARPWGSAELLYSRFATELGVYRGAHAGNFEDLIRSLTQPPPDEPFSYAIGRPNQRVSHDLVRARAELHLAGEARMELQYGFQHNHRREYDNHGPLRFRDVPAFDLTLYTHTLDARLRHAPAGALTGTVGVSGMWQDNHTDGKAFLIPAYRLLTGAAYAQEELALGRLTLSAGARLEGRRQATDEYADAGIVSVAETRTWGGVAGSVGASWMLGRGWSLAGRLGTGWRAPNVNERFAQGVHHGTAIYELGDTALTTERTATAEFTVRHAGPRLQLEVSGFANRIDGFIYLRPADPVVTIRGVFPGYRYAQTDALLRGLEASAAWQAAPGLTLQAVGNLVRGTDQSIAAGNDALYDMPQDRLQLSARYEARRGGGAAWHVEAGGQLVRRQDRVPPVTVYTLPTDGYALAHAEVGITGAALWGTRVDAVLAVRNLFDTSYRDYLSRYRLWVDDQGRDVVLRLRLPFGRWD